MADAVENGDIKEDFVEDGIKVDVEATSVNLDCVKSEPNEGTLDFEEDNHSTQYKITLKYEDIYGESSHQIKIEEDYDNLIGFLDNDVIMANAMIKLEAVKEEKDEDDGSINNLYCQNCKGIYKGYCLKCSTLLHILNKNTSIASFEAESNTIPTDILEIRATSRGKGVYLLRTLPINIIFGPFEGVLGIESIIGHSWKIIDNKLKNIKSGNWMKNIVCAASASLKNLDIYQIDGNLYFQTNREITAGEELLIYYGDEELQQLDNSKECLYTPQKQEQLPKIFACTMCCLGFGSNKCLMEHKRKCCPMKHSRSMDEFVLIECHYCKMWMDKLEHQEYHVAYCSEKHHRSCRNRNLPDFAPTTTDNEEQVHENDEVTQSIDVNASYSTHPTETIDSNNFFFRTDFKVHKEEYFHDENMGTTHSNTNEKKYKCSECSYQTNRKGNLKIHLVSHTDVKHFQYDICKQSFGHKSSLKLHIKIKHSNTNEKKYKCSECSFQTKWRSCLKIHLGRHTDVKNFQCDICKQRFGHRSSLKVHIKTKHSNTNEKEYNCSKCPYQTNRKGNLKSHLGTHSAIKHFQCDICKQRFGQKGHLNVHIKNKHSNTNEKEYKCSQCLYQTNLKDNLKRHLGTHGDIKHFQCDICQQRFGRKDTLKLHIKNKHSNTNEKEYKCSECSYQTNHKGSLKSHVGTIHSNRNEKEYKCSECSYQTNHKSGLKTHLVTHTDVKHFHCDICKQRFGAKNSLKRHIKNKHSNRSEKE